jgi:ABC-type glycerol-3-phosphate transport system permease component
LETEKRQMDPRQRALAERTRKGDEAIAELTRLRQAQEAREMEEAALLDRAGRLRALWHVILPQVSGGIAVTTIFVFLNAWNEFLFPVVLAGNTVRPVTVAMFNFISVEQTQWARLAAAAMLAMAPVIVIGLAAQRHIVKGLTVGAVKGGGRR